MALKPVTVSQLNEYISRILSTDPLLGSISVKGEISNLKYHSSGHVYFSMVDETSKINCFLPASYARNIGCRLGDGLEITVCGYINVYKKGGTYTLHVRSAEVSGEGDLATAFDLLKEKLDKEGLFDASHKKPIPAFPKKVGVVTSATGAAVRDIIKIITSKTKLTDVTVFPVPVQGEGAADEIADTLDMINKNFSDIDVLIVGRGGGSSEDLWAFNEEKLARAVYRSKIPVISAVGHEIDFSICDFVADKRAETPTAAAEIAAPDDSLMRDRIDELRRRLSSCLEKKLDFCSLLAESCVKEMRSTLEMTAEKLSHRIEKAFLTLNENDPAKILSKGYAIAEDLRGVPVTSFLEIKEGETYRLTFKDGAVEITASRVKRRAAVQEQSKRPGLARMTRGEKGEGEQFDF